MNLANEQTECVFKVTLKNKEIVKVVYKPFNSLVVHFAFYGCVSSTGYKSDFKYILDKVWNKYDDIEVMAKDMAQMYYEKEGYIYFNKIQEKQQLSLF